MAYKAESTKESLDRAVARANAHCDQHFTYSIYRLDNVVFEPSIITLSPTTRIRRLSTITSPIGKAMLGPRNIELSISPAGTPWNKVTERSGHVFPAFVVPMGFGGSRATPLIFPSRSACVIECSFQSGGPSNSNDRAQLSQIELRRVMTALRLLDDAPICGIGPLGVRFHPAMAAGGYDLGNLDDDELGVRRIHQGEPMQISRARARALRRLFKRLSATPAPNTWAIPARSRLHISQSRASQIDQIVDCAIGLESLFGGATAEIRYRCAALLGRDPRSRAMIAKNIGDFFRCRNRVVHGSSAEMETLIKKDTSFSSGTELLNFVRAVLRGACLILAQADDITRPAFRLKCDAAILAGRPVKL